MKQRNPTLRQWLALGAFALATAGLFSLSTCGKYRDKIRAQKLEAERSEVTEQEERELLPIRQEIQRLEREAGEYARQRMEEAERAAGTNTLERAIETNSQKKIFLKPNNGKTGLENPTRAISNEFFQNTGYINEEGIKYILAKEKSCLQNRGIEKTIVDCAMRYQINPIILLAKLQVEQGLVSKQKASKGALRYAAGYGALDNGKNLKSNGLTYQIENAARILRNHYDAFNGQAVKIDYGKRIVKPENNAAYAMLRYTPHTKGTSLNCKVIRNYIAMFD